MISGLCVDCALLLIPLFVARSLVRSGHQETRKDESEPRIGMSYLAESQHQQGIIHYNSSPTAYRSNPLTAIGDITRVQQDWSLVQLQASHLHNAALGIHGAFLLIRGAVENATTWETDVLTEDY